MSINSFSIPFIDDINTISDTIIEKCKIEYEHSGKEKAYQMLNNLIYNDNPTHNLRNLYLYRKAMLLTKKASILGEGYIEYEEDSSNIIIEPEWKKKKWSFLDTSNSTLKLRNIIGSGFITESQLRLDEYDKDLYYNKAYDSSTKLTVTSRGGKSVTKDKRFDFEYKYSSSEYYKYYYTKSIYDIFKRVFLNTMNHTVYNSLSQEEAETIYAILGLLTDEIKINIIRNIRNYILFEKETHQGQINISNAYRDLFNRLQKKYKVNLDSYGDYTVKTIYEKDITNDEKSNYLKAIDVTKDAYHDNIMLEQFRLFLSSLHDLLLIPFEYIAYLMCALINPRYEAIIEDGRGCVATHVFGGNHIIIPKASSSLGPSKNIEQNNTISTLIPNILLSYSDGVSLYENLFIETDQNYNISCYSYNKNKWLTDIPLVTDNLIKTLEENTERKIIKIIHCFNNIGHCIIWLIYSDYILSYDCNIHEWLVLEDNDICHLVNIKLSDHLSQNIYIKNIQYDNINKLLLILDTSGNISGYNLNNGVFISSNELENQPGDSLENIRDFIILNNNESKMELLVYNDTKVKIIRYMKGVGFTEIKQFDYSEDGSVISDIIKLNGEKKIYIIYDNHKIIEISTYMYMPYVLQKKVNSAIKPLLGNITYCNLNETGIYATSDNKLHIIHPIYNTKNKISTLELPLDKYILDGAVIKKYNEYLIQASSVSLFSNSYYAIMAYFESLKQPLSKRT